KLLCFGEVFGGDVARRDMTSVGRKLDHQLASHTRAPTRDYGTSTIETFHRARLPDSGWCVWLLTPRYGASDSKRGFLRMCCGRDDVYMAILTDDMKSVVREQSLGFVATVCPDGTPNLSPKGTTMVWDDDHLVFADIVSPGTIS